MDAPLQIVAEFGTIGAARPSAVAFDALLVEDRDEEVPMMEPLTAREVEVLELRAQGMPNKVIAGRLAISDQTVKFHVSSIVGSSARATVYRSSTPGDQTRARESVEPAATEGCG